jgi:hypothetical protein
MTDQLDTGDSGPWGTTRFAVGEHDGLAGPGTVGLVEGGHENTRHRLWELVARDASLDDILDELSTDGLKALPSFAIAQQDGGSIRVVARGTAVAEVTRADSAVVVVDAEGVRTWTEAVVDDAESVLLRIGDAPTRPCAYHVLAGWVPADALRRSFVDVDRHAAEARTRWGPTAADEPAPGAPATPERAADEPTPSDTAAAIDEPSDRQVSTPSIPNLAAPEPQPEAPAGPPVAAAPHPFDLLAPQAPAAGRPLISSVPISSVPAPTPRDHAPPADAPAEPVAAEPASSAAAAPEAIAPEPVFAPQEPNESADSDGLTITRDELARRRSSIQPTTSLRPNDVHAVLCAVGHPNPPHAHICRSCGDTIDPDAAQSPVVVQRPVLAVLAFSNGTRVPLDADVLMGRNPKVTDTHSGALPHVVKFDDVGPGLSRSHARVVLDGWQMMLEDLGSTNGTEITLPGQSRRRLRVNEPVMLEIGAVVDLDDDLYFNVEGAT